MEVKLCTDDFNLLINHNSVILKGKDEFILSGTATNFKGYGKFRSISNHVLEPKVNWDKRDKDRYIADLVLKKELFTPAAVILTPSTSIKNQIVTIGPVSAIISIGKAQTGTVTFENIPISTMIIVDSVLDQGILLKLILNIQNTISAVLWDLGVMDGFYNETHPQHILIVSKSLEDQGNPDEIREIEEIEKIEEITHECVQKATRLALADLGYPLSITQILSASGVEIDELVAAGAELLVGVDDSPEIRKKIKGQLIKSLEDINVISLVLAGIRVEDDYQHHRVRGVDVEDDPAYLYADEVLGMAIANQIAGTKAIFNFKRYDEEKPGIISQLGPMLDDVCAGLVAGCMSKIFEE
ncbi:MAG: phosphatidylglycerophosphatase A [Methanobacteriaceae archaeon]|nr:phosphatidylglycerophosphatase A [Methanobacteriaceae archaeon]